MFRISQLDIVAFAVGLLVGVALASAGWGWGIVGTLACVLHRVRFSARTFTVALGFFVGTIILPLHALDRSRLQLEGAPQDLSLIHI